jgi:hypothetical protein
MRYRAALCLAGLIAASCGGVIDPSKNTVENISGTLAPGGLNQHEFSSKSGEYSIKITALSPVSNIFMGVAYGPVSNGVCVITQSNPFAQLNLTALAGQIGSGRFCVHIYDVGGLTQTSTYTLAISHP